MKTAFHLLLGCVLELKYNATLSLLSQWFGVALNVVVFACLHEGYDKSAVQLLQFTSCDAPCVVDLSIESR